MENSTTETIGCDLGDKMSDVCVMDVAGRTRRARVASTRKGMTTFFTREPAHVVIEVGGHSRWVSSLLEGLGHRVTIANPRRVKLISASNNKTDEHDAELLARLGRADESLLAPMVHRGSEVQADLAIAKARDTLVATRTKLVNHVRGTVKSFGERLPKCSSSSFVRHTRALLPAALEVALAPVYETIAKLDEQIHAQDKLIEKKAEANPDVIGARTGRWRGLADGVGVRAHAGEQEPVHQQPDGRRLSRVAATQAEIRRRRPAAEDHQGGRPVRAASAGAERELHPGTVREGQRPATLGTQTRRTGWQECEEARQGGSSSQARRAPPPVCGSPARSTSRSATRHAGSRTRRKR